MLAHVTVVFYITHVLIHTVHNCYTPTRPLGCSQLSKAQPTSLAVSLVLSKLLQHAACNSCVLNTHVSDIKYVST
jgi:hypothetical protein